MLVWKDKNALILKPREPLKILNVIPSAKSSASKRFPTSLYPTKLLRHDYLETLATTPLPQSASRMIGLGATNRSTRSVKLLLS